MKKLLAILLLFGIAAGVGVYFLMPDEAYRQVVQLELKRVGMSEHRLEVGADEWPYLDSANASEKPAVVLLHGMGSNKFNWTRLAGEMSNDYRLIAVDLPGFGYAVRDPERSYLPKVQAPRLREFLGILGVSKAHLVGHGMGGHVAGEFVDQYPEMSQSLTLIDTAGVHEPLQNPMAKSMKSGVVPVTPQTLEALRQKIALMFVEPPFVPRPVELRLLKRSQEYADFNAQVFTEYQQVARSGLEPALKRSKLPLLVLWGEQNRVIDVSVIDVIRELRPDAKSHIIRRAGYMSPVEKPKEAAAELEKFLASVMAGNT